MVFCVFRAPVVDADEIYASNVRVGLISETSAALPGKPFALGLTMVMDEGWHTYWRNPGDSGMPTRIQWELPAGFTAGEIQWPYPRRFEYAGGLAGYGYQGATVLLIPIEAAEDVAKGEYELNALVRWLSCAEICVPGKAELSVKLIIQSEEMEFDALNRGRFMEVRRQLPVQAGPQIVNVQADGDDLVIRLDSGDLQVPETNMVTFYPFRNDLIDHAARQNLEQKENGYALRVKKSSVWDDETKRLEGVLVFSEEQVHDGDFRSLQFDVPIQ